MENGHVKRKQEERQSHDYGLKFGKGVNEINLGKEGRYGLQTIGFYIFTSCNLNKFF